MDKKGFCKDDIIWMNGNFTTLEKGTISIMTQGLHYSCTIFEGERAYSGKIFKINEHRERFFRSAEAIGINIEYSHNELNNAAEILLKKGNLKNAYIRMIAFTSSEDLTVGLTDAPAHVAICALQWDSYFSEKNGISLFVSNYKRPSPEFIPANIKASGMYTMSNAYKRDAAKNGFHDSLICDFNGKIADTTCANIFFIKSNEIYTPSAKSFLHGITREVAKEILKVNNIKLHEVDITIAEIDNFDGAFITGTAVEITPVKRIGSKIFSESEMVKKLQKEYSEIVHF